MEIKYVMKRPPEFKTILDALEESNYFDDQRAFGKIEAY